MKRSLLLLAAALSACAPRPSPVIAPAPARAEGLLVVAHGAGAEWNRAVRETVARVRWNGPVQVAFLMGAERDTAGWDSAVTRLERAGVANLVVVPLMVSSNGSHFHQVRHYAGLRAELPPELAAHAHHARQPGVPARVTPALDGAPEMAAVLGQRWSALGENRHRPVLFLGHGPSDDADAARWTEQLLRAGSGLAASGFRGELRVGLLRDDAAPPVRAAAVSAMRDSVTALAARSADSVLVMAVVVARSGLTRTTIPRDIAGLPVRYVPVPLAPAPELARWIERVARATSGPSGVPAEARAGW